MGAWGGPNGPHSSRPWLVMTSHTRSILQVCRPLCQRAPGEKAERRLQSADELTGRFRGALQGVGLAERPPGAARGAGTPRDGPRRLRERAASPPGTRAAGHLNLPALYPSRWQEEQIILRESWFWRLLDCSWHCSESFNSLENPKYFNIARIFAHRVTSPTTKRDPASVEPAHRRDTAVFLTLGGTDAQMEPMSPPLHRVTATGVCGHDTPSHGGGLL